MRRAATWLRRAFTRRPDLAAPAAAGGAAVLALAVAHPAVSSPFGPLSPGPPPGSPDRPAAATPVEPGWRKAVATLEMPVFRPTYTPGLTLKRVLPRRSCPGEQLQATYNSPDGALLKVYEGQPHFCGNIGDVPLRGRPVVNGSRAWLFDAPDTNMAGGLFLTWYARPGGGPRVELSLQTNDPDRRIILKVARSMRRIG